MTIDVKYISENNRGRTRTRTIELKQCPPLFIYAYYYRLRITSEDGKYIVENSEDEACALEYVGKEYYYEPSNFSISRTKGNTIIISYEQMKAILGVK